MSPFAKSSSAVYVDFRLVVLALCLLSQIGFAAGRSKARTIQGAPTSAEVIRTLIIHPVNEKGESVSVVRIPTEERVQKDLLFKYTVPDTLKDYESWGFEASDPSRNLRYQELAEGTLPPFIHWDGLFDSENGIQINQKYFVRLVLVLKNKKVVASPWTFFSTKPKHVFDGVRIGRNFVDLYIQPTVGVYDVMLETKDYKVNLYPSILGDVRLIWKDSQTLGIKFECTSNVLFGYTANSTGFAFSDFSLFYRYRLLGGSLHPPNVAFLPPYEYENARAAPPPASAYGKPTNVEIGARMFYTTLRGFDGTALDSELARQAEGLSAVLDLNQALWLFRLHTSLEAGYSLFRGSLFLWSLESALTFDRLTSFSPGIQLRYLSISGQPPSDQPNAGTQIQNTLVFIGGILYFKL